MNNENLLSSLNEPQKEAVTYNEGMQLVIAGAGSGKTRVLTHKLAYLIAQGYEPHRLMALTFTNKAADEMRQRANNLIGQGSANAVWMNTFHSVFLRFLRLHPEQIGYMPDFTIYDTADSTALIKAIIKEKALDNTLYKPNVVLSYIGRAKNNLQSHVSSDKLPQLSSLYEEYQRRLKQANAMDFDDILVNTYLLFYNNNDILAHYADRFRYILVDEYQDTNYAQHKIIELLTSIHHKLCVVGDDAQSIYSFRGANIGNILSFSKGAKIFRLEQNYRSTAHIIEAANRLISHNKDQIKKQLFCKQSAGEPVHQIEAHSGEEEAIIVTGNIRLLGNYNQTAILYRTHAQSRLFEDQLRKAGIPYKIYGGFSFYARKEIKDILAYFRLVVNPHDEEAFRRVVNYPLRGIGATTIARLSDLALSKQISLMEAIDMFGNKKLLAFKELITSISAKQSTMDAQELGKHIIKESGISDELRNDDTEEGKAKLQNMLELVGSLQSFANKSLSEYISEISLLTSVDEATTSEDCVHLMTIHSAKGLEYDNVFIVGLEENIFPSEKALYNHIELEEERRLMYVAITRAAKRCFLSFAKRRMYYGRWLDGLQASRFIKEALAIGSLSTSSFVSSPSSHSSLQKASASCSGFEVGDNILHDRFGKGTIKALYGNGDMAMAEIVFANGSTKKLLLRFARIKKM